jgi:hypothetical protein
VFLSQTWREGLIGLGYQYQNLWGMEFLQGMQLEVVRMLGNHLPLLKSGGKNGLCNGGRG